MQWYEVRHKDGTLIGRGFENRFYTKSKAVEIAMDFKRRTGSTAKVYRVQHSEQEVSI